MLMSMLFTDFKELEGIFMCIITIVSGNISSIIVSENWIYIYFVCNVTTFVQTRIQRFITLVSFQYYRFQWGESGLGNYLRGLGDIDGFPRAI